jgi:hypothetical protein
MKINEWHAATLRLVSHDSRVPSNIKCVRVTLAHAAAK